MPSSPVVHRVHDGQNIIACSFLVGSRSAAHRESRPLPGICPGLTLPAHRPPPAPPAPSVTRAEAWTTRAPSQQSPHLTRKRIAEAGAVAIGAEALFC